MRSLIFIATLFFMNIDVFSQGGVNVIYIAIDTVDRSLVGQKVMIDFKAAKGTKEHLIQKARICDTIQVAIDNKLITIIERKGIGVDYWYFEKEYLESLNYDSGVLLRINEIQILELRTDSIQFLMTIEQYKKTGRELEQVKLEIKDAWIPRKKIEGILVKE